MAEEIRNISLSNKKTFSIDGDLNRSIQLDTSDMNIIVRMEEVYPELQRMAVEAIDKMSGIKNKRDEEEESSLKDYSEVLKEIDSIMREKINYIFASDIADVCVPTGNMYDVINGEFRFEHLIDVLIRLYANDMSAEFKKMRERVKKHTAKYTNKRKR